MLNARQALTWQGERLEVIEIFARWRTPNGVGFRVRTAQAPVFELFYNEVLDTWQIKIT